MMTAFPAINKIAAALRTFAYLCLFTACTVSLLSSTVAAQTPFTQRGPQDRLNDPLGGRGFSFGGPPTADVEPVTFSAEFKLLEGKKSGKLSVTAKLAPGWHIFSQRKEDVPNLPTRLITAESREFSVLGVFKPDQDPTKHFDDAFEKDVYYFEESVTWTAPIRLADTASPENLKVPITVDGQVCAQSCNQVNEEFEATFAGFEKAPVGFYRPENNPLKLIGYLSPQTATPGSTLKLILIAKIDRPWHVYENQPTTRDEGNQPTVIAVTKNNGWKIGIPSPSQPPRSDPHGPLPYHEGTVTWTVDIEVPEDTQPGSETLSGLVIWQTCNDEGQCKRPEVANFSVDVLIGDVEESGNTPLAFTTGPGFEQASEDALQLTSSSAADAGEYSSYSPLAVLGIAFLAGLILNIMPCVLPVIGLKIMAFVHQAGENRSQIFMLNFAFVLGLLTVFMVLATLAAFMGLGWGGLFESLAFQVVMLTVVFAFALSFLGVWEVPIPGFVGSSGASKLAQKEGYGGAFSKGILTTLLATPCSGPMLIPAITWAIAQPVWLTYLTFFSLGLGMASPYLLIGIAPGLVKALPKPGPWMDTFKQIMGFVLMGTAVFLASGVGQRYLIPSISFMVAVGIACWWIGKTPVFAELPKQLKAWGAGLAVLAVGAFICFGLMISHHELDWQPYSKMALEDEVAKGNTVFVDFTADW